MTKFHWFLIVQCGLGTYRTYLNTLKIGPIGRVLIQMMLSTGLNTAPIYIIEVKANKKPKNIYNQ